MIRYARHAAPARSHCRYHSPLVGARIVHLGGVQAVVSVETTRDVDFICRNTHRTVVNKESVTLFVKIKRSVHFFNIEKMRVSLAQSSSTGKYLNGKVAEYCFIAFACRSRVSRLLNDRNLHREVRDTFVISLYIIIIIS